MSAHRYWRLYVTAVGSGGYTSLVELEMYESPGGPNVCTGGTAAASSVGFGWTPDGAFNGTISGNGWHSGTNNLPTTPEWISYDFGAGVTRNITGIKITARGDNNAILQGPKNFKLQFSDDNSTWSDLFTITGMTGWGEFFGTATFDATGRADLPGPIGVGTTSKRFWRVKATAVNGSNVFSLADIQLRTTPGGSNAATGGTAVSNIAAAGSAASCFDGVTTSYWNSGSCLPEWVGYDFGTAKEIVEVTLQCRAGVSTEAAMAPKDFTVEYWDVDHWRVAYTRTGESAWANLETRTYTFGSGPSGRRPVVFVCT